MTVSILAVIVLYKTSPQVSTASVTTLARALAVVEPGKVRMKVLLFDNSPVALGLTGLLEDEQYVSAPNNAGLATAYNFGIELAQEQKFDWLLTLDQDTVLPETFVSALMEALDALQPHTEIAAVVPSISGSGRVLSPYVFRWGAVPQPFSPGYVGVPDEPTYAINSAALLRVAALCQVGGYDPQFWLDASDHSIFQKLKDHGKRVYVAGNIQVSHDLSILSSIDQMSGARYRDMLAAESAFWDLNMNKLAGWERTSKLLFRLLRQTFHGPPELRQITTRYVFLRLFRTRRYRLQLWRREVDARPK